ncbi:hypothetical protein F2Q68_00029586 [Brassica cretica]|uniref:Uncharacterized protein n=2 Tax=Brassica cretica TaxID=69181 RepID=A0A3N6S9N5_BRACR|nr:hypothetical protein F2Q68_00029586 [Brassica cretica]KAF3492449.1 hypothetical protein DY000_02056083 [Brassica cretica]
MLRSDGHNLLLFLSTCLKRTKMTTINPILSSRLLTLFKLGRLTSLMAMGVSFTSHSNPLLRHLSPSPSWASRSSFLLPSRKTLQRRLASTEGYSTSTVCHPEPV